MTSRSLLAALVASSGAVAPAFAEEPAPFTQPAPPPPAPYSLPWQLRPVPIPTVVRSDTAIGFSENPTTRADTTTLASMLLGCLKIHPHVGVLARIGIVANWPEGGENEVDFLNPIVGGTYGYDITPSLKLNGFLGFALPFGTGGGAAPSPADSAALGSGIFTRSAMDNAMFAVNEFAIIPGAGIAWIANGLTVQFDVTILQLFRVRGETPVPNSAGVLVQANPDVTRTNSTWGIHVGWFAAPWLSVGGELRMQAFLSTPVAVQKDPELRETITAALGVRFHRKVGRVWLRPGIAFDVGLDAPMTDREYRIIQVDIPVLF